MTNPEYERQCAYIYAANKALKIDDNRYLRDLALPGIRGSFSAGRSIEECAEGLQKINEYRARPQAIKYQER
jgi:hypothetical protein